MKNEVPSLKDLIQNVRDFADELNEKCDHFEKQVEEKKVPFRVNGLYENRSEDFLFLLISRLYGIPEYRLVNCNHGMLCHTDQGDEWFDRKIIQENINDFKYLGQLSDILKKALNNE